MNALFGKKLSMTQRYNEKGVLQTVSVVEFESHTVTGVKTVKDHGYEATVVGVGKAYKPTKALNGVFSDGVAPRLRKELRGAVGKETGSVVKVDEVFKAGDVVRVSGVSKGKGFTGVVKRHGFAGGPKTHGQSDRHRAPGSIGAGTTMGRVLKGLRMAGRSGGEMVSVRNLTVLFVREDGLMYLSGPIPGHYGSVLKIEKIGEKKNFLPIVLLDSDQMVVKQESSEVHGVSDSRNEDDEAEQVTESAVDGGDGASE